jgi:integrase
MEGFNMRHKDKMPRRLPKYCVEDTDRHGKARVYLRIPGRNKVSLPGMAWSAEFMTVYAAHMGSAQSAPRAAAGTHTWAWLCRKYFASAELRMLAPRTQLIRRRILERTFDEPIRPGAQDFFRDMPLSEMGPAAIRVLRDRCAEKPDVANERLKAIRQVFVSAIAAELVELNPSREVPYFKRRSDGFYTWTLDDVSIFEKRHGPGTKARRALYLLLYGGPRRSDVVTLGRQMVTAGVLKFQPLKTKASTGTVVEVPVLPILREELERMPAGRMLFLETSYGKPFTANGFGNWFKKRCEEAGLSHCSAHGLRKAGATRAAENGATAYQLMAMYGWASVKQAEVYTRKAQRKILAASGMHFLENASEISAIEKHGKP